MATAQLQIKNSDGTLVLDLSNRITRVTQTLTRALPANGQRAPEFIVLGAASELTQFWCAVRFSATKLANGKEHSPQPALIAFIATVATINASNLTASGKLKYTANMNAAYTYLIIDDGRYYSAAFNVVNSCIVNVGKY